MWDVGIKRKGEIGNSSSQFWTENSGSSWHNKCDISKEEEEEHKTTKRVQHCSFRLPSSFFFIFKTSVIVRFLPPPFPN